MQKVVSIEQAIEIIRPFPCWRIWTVEGGGAERLYTETKGQKDVSFEDAMGSLSPAYFSLVKVKYSNTDGNINNTPALYVRIGEATEAELKRLITNNQADQNQEYLRMQQTIGRERIENQEERLMLRFEKMMAEVKLAQANQENKNAHDLREKEHDLNVRKVEFDQKIELAKIEEKKTWISLAGTLAGAAIERFVPGAGATLGGFGNFGTNNEAEETEEQPPTQAKPKSTGFEIE